MPNGIQINSNVPNGVIMAVLGIESLATFTCQYALVKSRTVKTFLPARQAEKSLMFGGQYDDGVVTRMSCL